MSNISDDSHYHIIKPLDYPLFHNYQLIGDSQLLRFSKLFLNSKQQYSFGKSGRIGYCISGQKAAQLANHLTTKSWPVYKNVILLIGTNDIKDSTDSNQWKASLEQILELFLKYNVGKLILCTVPPLPKLWHTVPHWSRFVEYNEALRELENTYRAAFSRLKLLDITHIFLSKESCPTSFYCNRLDLYVTNPVPDAVEFYDEHFMMSNAKKFRTGSKQEDGTALIDRSYLKQSISLYDLVNMRYKLLSCFNGNTSDQDAAINKDRFDLIGVTMHDVWNIKSNLINIGNVEYLYFLRHAFQKFIAHLYRERYQLKRNNSFSSDIESDRDLTDELLVPSKVPRSDQNSDLDMSGVYCRPFDSTPTSHVANPGHTPLTSIQSYTGRTSYSNMWGAGDGVISPCGRGVEGTGGVDAASSSGGGIPVLGRYAMKRQHPPGKLTGPDSNEDRSKVVTDPESGGVSVTILNRVKARQKPRQQLSILLSQETPTLCDSDPKPSSAQNASSVPDTEGKAPPPARKRKERSFKDVLNLIQTTLTSLKVDKPSRSDEKETAEDEKETPKTTLPSLCEAIVNYRVKSKRYSMRDKVNGSEVNIGVDKISGGNESDVELRDVKAKQLTPGEKVLGSGETESRWLLPGGTSPVTCQTSHEPHRGENQRVVAYLSPEVLNNLRRVTPVPATALETFMRNDLALSESARHVMSGGECLVVKRENETPKIWVESHPRSDAKGIEDLEIRKDANYQTLDIEAFSKDVPVHQVNLLQTEGRLSYEGSYVETPPCSYENLPSVTFQQDLTFPQNCTSQTASFAALQPGLVSLQDSTIALTAGSESLPDLVAQLGREPMESTADGSIYSADVYAKPPLDSNSVNDSRLIGDGAKCPSDTRLVDFDKSSRYIELNRFDSAAYGDRYIESSAQNFENTLNSENYAVKSTRKKFMSESGGDFECNSQNHSSNTPFGNTTHQFSDNTPYERCFESVIFPKQDLLPGSGSASYADNCCITIPGLAKTCEDVNQNYTSSSVRKKLKSSDEWTGNYCSDLIPCEVKGYVAGNFPTPRSSSSGLKSLDEKWAPESSASLASYPLKVKSQAPETKWSGSSQTCTTSRNFLSHGGNPLPSTPNVKNEAPLDCEEVLNIEYLTPDEKQEQATRRSKRALCSAPHETRLFGYGRLFMLRANTIQLYQYVQGVCNYGPGVEMEPVDEKTFYAKIRTLRSPSVSDLEYKFYTSLLGSFEFYKFIKYISLNYIVPKVFSNQLKKVMVTSLVDEDNNLDNYVVRSLDISVFETHFSRPASTNTPAHKNLRVDLIHLNPKGFELLRKSFLQAIDQIENRNGKANV